MILGDCSIGQEFHDTEFIYHDPVTLVKTSALSMFASFALNTPQNLERTPGESWAMKSHQYNWRTVEKEQ